MAEAKAGDTTNDTFRTQVYDEVTAQHGVVTICVPAAGITRDALAVRMNKETGKAEPYSITTFRQVTEVNLIAPIYWAIEMVVRIAEDRCATRPEAMGARGRRAGGDRVHRLGLVARQQGANLVCHGQGRLGRSRRHADEGGDVTTACAAGSSIPGFTDTPMARELGEEYLEKNVLPYTQLRRLIRTEEIADAICFMISNSAVSGELWADAGWHPQA